MLCAEVPPQLKSSAYSIMGKPSLSEAVKISNAMPVEAFKSISRRVVRRLADPSHDSLLTASEEKQACSTLGLSSEQLSALIGVCAYIFEQAAYQMQRPEQFEQHLATSMPFSAAHAAAARQVWETEAGAYVARLRERHVLGSRVLCDTTWSTQLSLASRASTVKKSINESSTAILDLHLADDKNVHAAKPKEHLVLESSHADLYAFFLKLQDIQRTIDKLSS